MANSEQLILELLDGHTIDNKISRKALVDLTHFTERYVRSTIEELRKKGYRIASNNDGYYLCSNDKEFKDFLRLYLADAITRFETAKAMQGQLEGQIEWEMKKS